MAHPLFWPGKYYFYPIGNTSAVSLNTDIAPEAPARILLLGCGDPRNVLHTIFTEPLNSGRTLDFTCCDFDPAVLARNVLLLTMVADGQACTTIWNIFFHFRLDRHSHTALVDQCKKLIALSETTQKWRTSPYASFIKMCTEYTLTELRRHWMLYVGMQDLPKARLAAVHSAFDQQCKEHSAKVELTYMCARSLGPLWLKGFPVICESFSNFWETGVTFVDRESIAAAELLNPTFVYSLGGEGCSLHYGTDPLVPFHLAALFGNAKTTVSMTEVVKAAMQEFTEWCTSYTTSLSSTSPPIIRLFVGEANAVCRALFAFSDTGTLKLGIPVSQWKSQLIQLCSNEYKPGGAPTSFNVIHTSNLVDHIGLLNILVASIPLLSQETPCVLYTESLLFLGENATKEFTEHLHADLSVIGILLGLCPVDYLCGFSTRGNTHEVLLHRALKSTLKENRQQVSQFHQVTTWKVPTSGDTITSQNVANISRPSFDGHQLGSLLYDVYQSLFQDETALTFFNNHKVNLGKAITTSDLVHFTREGFVLFLKLIRHRLLLAEDVWATIMDRFMTLELSGLSNLSMEALHHKDLCVQLHRHNIYRAPFFRTKAQKSGRYSDWDAVPDLVRIVLIIPRENLAVLEHSKAEDVGTPSLHCIIFGVNCMNYFTSVDAAFGRAVSVGPKSHPQVIFEEDVNGQSPLVTSFIVPAWLLSDQEPPGQLNVGLGVYNTPAALMRFGKKFGPQLQIFSAKLLDETYVHVLPEQSLPPRYSPQSPHPPKLIDRAMANMLTQIGQSGVASVELDQECELISSLTIRVSIIDGSSLKLFSEVGSKVTPEISQLSPCVIRIKLGGKIQDIAYPLPVIGNRDAFRVRLARKSRYIEVVVPPSRSLLPDGMKLNPFPVISTEGRLNPWSIHRVNLSTLPILDLNKEQVKTWLNPHVGSMMSSREASLKKKKRVDTLVFVKDTLHSIFVRASGIQDTPVQRLFALLDKETKNCDTIIFICNLRFDLASHTMISDGYVLPLTPRVLREKKHPFEALLKGGIVHIPVFEGEMRAWKQLLPAFVERCRLTWKHGPNCEYVALGRIPLTEDMEEDADPLCSCGRGRDVEEMHKVALWKEFAPYVTRVALSPLFGVSYLETVGRGPSDHRCSVCRKRVKSSLKECSACKKVRYCSPECQKKDWGAHKPKCRT